MSPGVPYLQKLPLFPVEVELVHCEDGVGVVGDEAELCQLLGVSLLGVLARGARQVQEPALVRLTQQVPQLRV